MKEYRNLLIWIRIIICFVAAFYININPRWDLLHKAFITPRFYLAVITSFGICYALLYLIHLNNDVQNRYFPWRRNVFVRVILQICGGVIIPIIVDSFLVYLYLFALGLQDRMIVYFMYYMLTVVLFVIGVNGVYIILDLHQNIGQRALRLEIKHNGADVVLNVHTDILYIYKDVKNVRIMTISGHEYSKKDTIKNIIKTYSNSGLYQINQSTIVNLDMLKGHHTGSRSKTLDLVFKTQFNQVIASTKFEKLYVTREFIQKFKAALEKTLAG